MIKFRAGDKIEFVDSAALEEFLAGGANAGIYEHCFTNGIAEVDYVNDVTVHLVTRQTDRSLLLASELKYFKLVEEVKPEPTSATSLLQDCMDIQLERGKQYDGKQGQERSFKRVADAYNAITHSDLKGSDVALILQILKDVRMYTNMDSLHEDSVLDKVSYASLHGEELYNEFNNN
ncbi:DUF6378 domain-containing protein [Crocinitomicaceae bacterium]|nr:DUF6378 domain-containing protein [Crocinitomicaceae bacterium]